MLQDVCNWHQWTMNDEESNTLINSKKDNKIELRPYSYNRIHVPSDSSTPNILSPIEDHYSGGMSSSEIQLPRSSLDCTGVFEATSFVIPATSFVNCKRRLKVAPSSNVDCESAIVRRYSDIIFSNHDDLHKDSFSNFHLKSDLRYVQKSAQHHLSHNVITQNRNLGIEEIGLDYMRANGAIPVFRQLQHSVSRATDHKSSRTSLLTYPSVQPKTSDKSKRSAYHRHSGDGNDNNESSNKAKKLVTHSTTQGYKFRDNRESHTLTGKSMKSVGYRLGRRKDLYEKRLRISDFSLSFAIFGIIVMVIDSELLWAGIYRKNSIYSILLKSLISISTLVLLGLVLAYHALVIQLFSCDDAIEDWKIAITWRSVAQLSIELAICSIHPVPGHYSISNYFASSTVNMNIEGDRLEFMIEPVLSLPMLLRFYMIFRSLLLHSRMFRDAGSRSIGAMNKVSFDTRFILKTLMTMCPGTMLLTFILSLWILLGWTMRMCEINTGSPMHANILNCLWLIAVTFLSIGYGDIVPHTNCGRGIAVTAGVMGSACTALLVAVFARKLELSKAEKHVTQFMLENQMTKKLKYYAANVLRETWLIYKYTKLVKHVNPSKVRTHQRKFLKAIHGLRKSKIDQRKFKDNSNTLVDLAKTQTNIYETVTEMRVDHSCLEQRISRIENNLQVLQEQLKNLPEILSNIMTLASNGSTLAPLPVPL